MKKKIFIIVFFIFGLSQESFAYSSNPKQFIQEIVDDVKKFLWIQIQKNLKQQNCLKWP